MFSSGFVFTNAQIDIYVFYVFYVPANLKSAKTKAWWEFNSNHIYWKPQQMPFRASGSINQLISSYFWWIYFAFRQLIRTRFHYFYVSERFRNDQPIGGVFFNSINFKSTVLDSRHLDPTFTQILFLEGFFFNCLFNVLSTIHFKQSHNPPFRWFAS